MNIQLGEVSWVDGGSLESKLQWSELTSGEWLSAVTLCDHQSHKPPITIRNVLLQTQNILCVRVQQRERERERERERGFIVEVG